mmetsp:Transcript_34302/g.80204  ORF Transcript_34302/g.80204 Transcript_34302/m.80204 type:complete len:638 (-) Transcript_34302:102-2015(-)|eukprot:CAMPEP_0178403620 /NCGR_PEP_ID=MMETSP0689_2-20121128/17463_1 /TAXON_ID=160604 /ORGANISM="Amphidinium massartii, Strain CS-259" /LENGTH=637 /DNA_ID=CAMNT_0020024581 /DNA_START=151 /DNA_END=2064 /DNA_ORIENTATION=+
MLSMSDFGLELDAALNFIIQTLYVLRMEITFGLALAFLSLLTRTAGLWFSPRKAGKVSGTKASSKVRTASPFGKGSLGSLSLRSNSSQVCTPAELAAEVAMLCRVQPTKALERYKAEVQKGLNIGDMPAQQCLQLMTELMLAAIRSSLAEQALDLLHDLQENGPGATPALLGSVVKMCTSKRSFQIGLRCYDILATEVPMAEIEKSVWSCLLFCALEVKAYSRCWFFFERVTSSGPPSGKDLGNMVRASASCGDMEKALQFFAEIQKGGHERDSFVCNTLVAALVQEDWVDEAAKLVKELPDVTDPITYNTLMKGFTRTQRMDQCFEVFEQMRAKGVSPSQVTYGILLDGCVNSDMADKAADIFETMKREGCAMNTILYTTLMKGFARAGKLDQAMTVYDQMKENASLDIITFSILIKANCDASRLEAALKLLEEMVELGFQPDEVVFNNLLAGCANQGNISLGRRLYSDLLKVGLKPSTATFSILLRLYTKCKLYDDAVELLRSEPLLRNVEAEERLYVQLFQTFARERQGRRCMEVFTLMCEPGRSCNPSAGIVGTLLKTCVKLNMFQTAVEILEAAAAQGQQVQASDANMVLEGSLKKKKTSWARASLNSMLRLGLKPEAKLAEQAYAMLESGN